ncbi:hypothetical protein C8J56DRAFT_466227 [Mycena floridula]|nr:hypothetical protein C8J56DRAFT_466227 [Mycena floridula]
MFLLWPLLLALLAGIFQSVTTHPIRQDRLAQHEPKRTIRFSKIAENELTTMRLFGPKRESMIQWHKTQTNNEIVKNPRLRDAKRATIRHVVHEGGSNPNEAAHITVSFEDSNRQAFSNPFNGGRTHHVYVNPTSVPLEAKAAMIWNNARIRSHSPPHSASSRPEMHRQRSYG